MRSSIGSFPNQHDERPLRVPPKSATVNLRPISDASSISSMSSTATTVTGRSVNDILSIAGDEEMDDDRRRESLFSDFEIPSQPNENISIQQLMMTSVQQQQHQFQKSTPQQQQQQQQMMLTSIQQQQQLNSRMSREQVQPVLLADKPVKTEEIKNEIEHEIEPMDLDVNTLYDDVLQCVYDDVDTKYDSIDLIQTDATPPVPPIRKQRCSESVGRPAPPTPESETGQEPETLDKPLPDTPSKVPAILTKLAGGSKKNNSAKELEEQKKKELEEQKKKEKEAEKQREKEEKEKEKALKKQEELEKKRKKKQKMEEENVTSPRQSLFQRLFSK
jgi:hypothetical protein